MQIISLKIKFDILKRIDSSLEDYNFSTRTEFIREAIRDKLNKLENESIGRQLARSKKNEFADIVRKIKKEYKKR